jgi:hypothetical protein
MVPWFTATERFHPSVNDGWDKYIEWSKLTQLEEIVSLDSMLNPPVLRQMKDEYWAHVVHKDYTLAYFLDLDYLQAQLHGATAYNLLCVYRNPTIPPSPPKLRNTSFDLLGYDVLDVDGIASALTNCGGFPDVFSNDELTPKGLLKSHTRALEVQAQLAALHPEEAHADCDVWAIARAIEL